MSVAELSVQLKNTPGQLAQVTNILAEGGVNILGMSATGAGKAGVARLVVDKPKLASEALEECGMEVESGEVVAILLDDESGSLDTALGVLGADRINLDYVYTCVRRVGGKVMAVLGTASPGKVERLLAEAGLRVVG